MYYTEYIFKHNTNPKKVWQIINSLIPRKTVNSFVKNISVYNIFVDYTSDVAQEFNKYFVEIGIVSVKIWEIKTTLPQKFSFKLYCPKTSNG